jgi:hypothetical protein
MVNLARRLPTLRRSTSFSQRPGNPHGNSLDRSGGGGPRAGGGGPRLAMLNEVHGVPIVAARTRPCRTAANLPFAMARFVRSCSGPWTMSVCTAASFTFAASALTPPHPAKMSSRTRPLVRQAGTGVRPLGSST